MKKYDLTVIGSGPGGYVAAIRAAQLGLKTAIIEKENLGGVCLNWGCIPTKALLKNAEVLHLIKNSKRFGIDIPEYSVDFDKVIKRSRDVAGRLSKGVGFLMKKNNIEHIVGTGQLLSSNEVEIVNDGEIDIISSDKIIIATGARPKTIPGIEIDGKSIISSKEALILEQPPEEMVIIGAGAIGIEFAYFYNEYGTKVHIVEMLSRILPLEDEDISKELTRSLKKSGIKISSDAKVKSVEKSDKKIIVTIEHNEEEKSLIADKVLVAVGVAGNIENIGLKNVGVKSDKGAIQINDFCQTNVPNIYAIGDVTGTPLLAHVASKQGHIASEHASGKTPRPVDYKNIPGCTYCQPQVASLGLTEQQARDEEYDIKVGSFNYRAIGKALAIGESTGFAKLIFDSKSGELLGAHIIGAEATELIAEIGIAKALETTWKDIAETIHAHPTLSEIIMEAAADAFGEAIHH